MTDATEHSAAKTMRFYHCCDCGQLTDARDPQWGVACCLRCLRNYYSPEEWKTIREKAQA